MGEMVVFGQNDFNLVLIGQSGCNYAKWLYVILARIKPIYKDKILEKSKLVNRPVGGGGGGGFETQNIDKMKYSVNKPELLYIPVHR